MRGVRRLSPSRAELSLPLLVPRLLNRLELILIWLDGAALEVFEVERPFADVGEAHRHRVERVVFLEQQGADGAAVGPGPGHDGCPCFRTILGSLYRGSTGSEATGF